MKRIVGQVGSRGLIVLMAVGNTLLSEVVAATPVQETVYFKAHNTRTNSYFGEEIDMSRSWMVVGAPFETSARSGFTNDLRQAGAAYVFRETTNGWIQSAMLVAEHPDPFDRFGGAVAIDGSIIVVGAEWEYSNAQGVNGDGANNDLSYVGAAYVFELVGTNWVQTTYLKGAASGWTDHFGDSVDVSGDTIVVGASSESGGIPGVNGDEHDNSEQASGAAYVFVKSGSNWVQQAYLKPSIIDRGAYFGTSVAISGDTIVVSAPSEDYNPGMPVRGFAEQYDAGAAYVFVRSGTNWTQQARFTAPNIIGTDSYGFDVDVDRDRIVVSSHIENSHATGVNGDWRSERAVHSGATFLYQRAGTNWNLEAYLKASNTDRFDGFGTAVSISGDLLAVSTPYEDSSTRTVDGNQSDNTATNSGAAYLFRLNGTNWQQFAYLKSSNSDPEDWFGSSLAIDANRVAVGAKWEGGGAVGVNGDMSDNSRYRSGAAYLIHFDPDATVGPLIRTQPKSQIVSGGQSPFLQVEAPDVGRYQWFFNQSPITGQTNSSLQLPDVQRSAEGFYHVETENSVGTTRSSAAFLRVLIPQRIKRLVRETENRNFIYFADDTPTFTITTNSRNFELHWRTRMPRANDTEWNVLTYGLQSINDELRIPHNGYPLPNPVYYRIVER